MECWILKKAPYASTFFEVNFCFEYISSKLLKLSMILNFVEAFLLLADAICFYDKDFSKMFVKCSGCYVAFINRVKPFVKGFFLFKSLD